MAILSLLFGKTKGSKIQVSKTLGALGSIVGTPQSLVIDASIAISHDTEATPTEYPVEEGSKISDHIMVEPATVTIEGIITDTPLGFEALASGLLTAGARAVASKALGGLGATAGAIVGGSIGALLSTSDNKVRDSYLFLRELQTERVTFTLVTSLQSYSNMVLQRLSVPQETKFGNSLKFTATMKQIRIVSSFLKILPEGTLDAAVADAMTNISEGDKLGVNLTGLNAASRRAATAGSRTVGLISEFVH